MMSSMQYNMGQMMFPDAQRYLQIMGFMSMGMGVASAGMQHPVMPFGPILPYPPVLGQSPANLRPRLMPSFHPANVAISDQVRLKASNQKDPASGSINMMNPNMVQIPNFADPYHHYAPLPHLQVSSQVRIYTYINSILQVMLLLMLVILVVALPKKWGGKQGSLTIVSHFLLFKALNWYVVEIWYFSHLCEPSTLHMID